MSQNEGSTAAGAGQTEAFLADLERQGISPHTVLAFQRWFDGANQEDFEA